MLIVGSSLCSYSPFICQMLTCYHKHIYLSKPCYSSFVWLNPSIPLHEHSLILKFSEFNFVFSFKIFFLHVYPSQMTPLLYWENTNKHNKSISFMVHWQFKLSSSMKIFTRGLPLGLTLKIHELITHSGFFAIGK